MKVLLPTDFSEGAEQAQAEAMRLARALGAELIVLHVLVPLAHQGEALLGPAELDRLQERQRRWAEGNLETRVVEIHRAGVPARGLLWGGEPAREIVRAAEDEQVDLIVMGTYGRSGLSRLLLGSVADRVVRTAPCPVVTVRGRKDGGR